MPSLVGSEMCIRDRLMKKETLDLTKDNKRLEINLETKKKQNDELEAEFDTLLQKLEKELENEKNEIIDKQLKELESQRQQNQELQKQKQHLEVERLKFKELLQQQRKDQMRQLADKEREKVQATTKLNNDMYKKIEETKESLMALKKEQIETTNKLTVLQNHQLTTELEYQSKQTEKLLNKNTKLTEQIAQLKRDVEIHKQVESELANRSHTSQKFIKNMSEQIKQMEENNEQFKKKLQLNSQTNTTGTVSYTHLTLPTICSVQISVVVVSLKKKNKSQKTTEQTTKSLWHLK
eukprot:TRINITY_DN4602_c0_g1_i1.p1 TRINITY_DN4602_c0_g1~~TRINITY_DN4602_c0_g1_i1.p1  ORF type:complete len:294 (-),score=72.77 TRINITY_DN4602_c0_g1_i1:42-923(-)